MRRPLGSLRSAHARRHGHRCGSGDRRVGHRHRRRASRRGPGSSCCPLCSWWWSSPGCWLLVGAVLRPVHRLADEATRLSVDEPGGRLPVPSADSEVAVLTRSLNALLERVERSVERERTFVDDASHELRTPLTVLRGELELAELDLASDDPKAVDRATSLGAGGARRDRTPHPAGQRPARAGPARSRRAAAPQAGREPQAPRHRRVRAVRAAGVRRHG